MPIYEVTADVAAQSVESFERYMRTKHIPEILATGCFARILFEKAAATKFRTRYEAVSQEDLDRYLNGRTAHFRADFLAHFPEGVTLGREVWMLQEAWKLEISGEA